MTIVFKVGNKFQVYFIFKEDLDLRNDCSLIVKIKKEFNKRDVKLRRIRIKRSGRTLCTENSIQNSRALNDYRSHL